MLLLAINTLTSRKIPDKDLDRLMKTCMCREEKTASRWAAVSDVLANQKSAYSETPSLLSRQREATKSLVTPRFFPVGYLHLLWLPTTPTDACRHPPTPADAPSSFQVWMSSLSWRAWAEWAVVSCLKSFHSVLLIMFWLLCSGHYGLECLVLVHSVAQPDLEETPPPKKNTGAI